MEINSISEKTALKMIGIFRDSCKNESISRLQFDKTLLIFKQSAKKQILIKYERYVLSYFNFDWKYPINRLLYLIAPINLVEDRIEANRNIIESEIKSLHKVMESD